MSQRKFYRNVIQVEVLSEDMLSDDTLEDLAALEEATTTGDCSGKVVILVHNQECDGKTMARLLTAQNSDPDFFSLTDEGEDVKDEED